MPQLPPPAPPPPIPSVLSAHFQSPKFPTERITYCLNEMRTVTSKIPTFRGLKRGVRAAGCLCVLVCTSVCIYVCSCSVFNYLFPSPGLSSNNIKLRDNAFLWWGFYYNIIRPLTHQANWWPSNVSGWSLAEVFVVPHTLLARVVPISADWMLCWRWSLVNLSSALSYALCSTA